MMLVNLGGGKGERERKGGQDTSHNQMRIGELKYWLRIQRISRFAPLWPRGEGQGKERQSIIWLFHDFYLLKNDFPLPT